MTDELLQEYEWQRVRIAPEQEPLVLPTSSKLAEVPLPALRALRFARSFWTQTGKVQKNRGAGRPGNQIEMTRGARAFFGSTVPSEADVNTALGHVRVIYAGERVECNLRFNANGMDKITRLPTSAVYDHAFVLWERRADLAFEMSVMKNGADLIAKSSAQGTRFTYGGARGRQWGFYS